MKKQPHFVPSIIAIIFLLGAMLPLPVGYYTLLRFVVCGVAVYIAYLAYEYRQMWAMWTFGLMAVVFNPIIKIYLGREVWLAMDLLALVLFVVALIKVKKQRSEK